MKGELIRISIPELRSRILLRAKTSDVWMFEQIYLHEEYKFDLPFTPKYILDCGANIGLAAIFFANRYPDATIVSIEPQQSNFDLLNLNVAHYTNIQTIRAGIWGSLHTYLKVENPNDQPSRFRLVESAMEEDSVPAITVTELMTEAELERIDLLKLDVEGAEKEVFSGDTSWIKKTNAMVVEFHNNSQESFMENMLLAINEGFDRFQSGENYVFVRRTPVNTYPDLSVVERQHRL